MAERDSKAVTAAWIPKPRVRSDGTLAHRCSYRWEDVQGEDVTRRVTSRTFDTAQAAAHFKELVERFGWREAEAIADARTGAGKAQVPTVALWLEQWLGQAAVHLEPGTIAEYRRVAARSWLDQLGEYPVTALTAERINAWMVTRKNDVSAKTIANEHGLLSTLLTAAVRAGHRTDNPAAGMRLPKGQKGEMTFLTASEFARLLRAVPPHWQPLVAFLAGTGLRWGEATALRWANVDLDGARPQVRVMEAWKKGPGGKDDGWTVLGIPKTSRSRRTVDLPPQLVDVLRARRRGPDQLVFVTDRGNVIRHANFHQRVWRPALRASGLTKQPRIHDLRHSFASLQIHSGTHLVLIQRAMGHESIKTTIDVYGHLADDLHGVAAAAAGAFLADAIPAVAELEG